MSSKSLSASFWLTIAIQTVSAIDMPGKGKRKMPAPRAYVAAIILWSIFGIISDIGQERAAAAMAWATVLAGAILGTMGKTLTDFLTTVGDQFAPPGTPKMGGGGDGKPASGEPLNPDTQAA